MNTIPRAVVAFLLVIPALTGCETMKAVDRGLYSATEGVTEIDRVTGQRSLSLADREEQVKKGNENAEKILEDARALGKRLNDEYNAEAYERIRRIFGRLHHVSHLSREKWTPVLVEEDAWNAFTTGGTYFIIYSGLEEDLKDDSELANVIAHEMAHTVANHVFEGFGYLKLNALAGSKSAKRKTFQAAFSHENEAEADRIAVLYCALAGFDPYAGARIWQRMHKRKGNNASFIHDHPMNAERAAEAQGAARLVGKYYVDGEINPNYREVLANNELFSLRSSDVAAGEGGGFLALLDAGLSTFEQRQQAKAEEQRQQYRIRFMESVHRVSKIVRSEPVAANRWRFTIHYRGNLALTDLSFKATVQRVGGGPLVITQHVNGVLRPNAKFYVDFESEELEAYTINPRNVQLRYDNARAF